MGCLDITWREFISQCKDFFFCLPYLWGKIDSQLLLWIGKCCHHLISRDLIWIKSVVWNCLQTYSVIILAIRFAVFINCISMGGVMNLMHLHLNSPRSMLTALWQVLQKDTAWTSMLGVPSPFQLSSEIIGKNRCKEVRNVYTICVYLKLNLLSAFWLSFGCVECLDLSAAHFTFVNKC